MSAMPLTNDEDIAELLTNARTIAMVGASDRPSRPSYGVMKFLQDWGYRVFPVNPQITGEHVLGEFVWRELAQIGVPIDIVDIFRRPEACRGSGRTGDFHRRQGRLDADWSDQRGRSDEGGSGRIEGRDGSLPEDRDSKVAGAAGVTSGLNHLFERRAGGAWAVPFLKPLAMWL